MITWNPFEGGGDSNSSVVVFDIKGNDHHLCLSDCELIVECKLVGADGNALPNSIHQDRKNFRRTCIEPQLIHSLWSNVEVKINNANIRAHVHHYGLKAYIDTLLTTDEKDQETLGVTTLFEKELNFDEIWTAVTIGDETVQVVDQKCTPFAHVRQVQTQLQTRPPASEPRCETNLLDWNTTTDLIGNSIDFLHDDATILGLTTAAAEVVEESPSSTGIFTNQPLSSILTPEESQQELINLYETPCTQANGNNTVVNPLAVQYYHQQSEPFSHQQ